MIDTLVAVLVVGLVVCCHIIVRQRQKIIEEERANHAKCMALISAFIGDHFAAKILDNTADFYDSMDGLAEQRRIVNTLLRDMTEPWPSVPATFLRERAASLRALHEESQ